MRRAVDPVEVDDREPRLPHRHVDVPRVGVTLLDELGRIERPRRLGCDLLLALLELREVAREGRLVDEPPVGEIQAAALGPFRLERLGRDPELALAEDEVGRQREAPVAGRQLLVDERVDGDPARDAFRAELDVDRRARQHDRERGVEAVAVEPVEVGLGEPRVAGVDDLERDLGPVVEPELDAAEGDELVALDGVVALRAEERKVAREQEVPLRALALLEDGEDRVLEGKARPRNEADGRNVRRQPLERADALDESLEDAVAVEIHFLDPRQLREGHEAVLVPRDPRAGGRALVLAALALRRNGRRDGSRRDRRPRARPRRLRGSRRGQRQRGRQCEHPGQGRSRSIVAMHRFRRFYRTRGALV